MAVTPRHLAHRVRGVGVSATKPEAAGLTDMLAVLKAHEHGGIINSRERWTQCACGKRLPWRSDEDDYDDRDLLRAHVAVEVSRWLRTALLGDDVVEAAAFGMRGQSSVVRARTALTAALDRVEALSAEEAGT